MKNLLYNGPNYAILHEEFSKQGKLDEKASIISKSQVYVNAPVERVWNVVYQIMKWQEFLPHLKKIQLHSSVKTDALFTFSFNKMPIKAKFAVVKENQELSWTGLSLWTKAIDRITLKSVDHQNTQLTIEESLSGTLIALFISEKQLAKQHQLWLAGIKKKAES